MGNRLGGEARFKHVMEIAVFVSVFCLSLVGKGGLILQWHSFGGIGDPVAFEVIWVFSETPGCAEEGPPVPPGSQGAVPTAGSDQLCLSVR